jgi:hypothetical protein
MCFTVTGKKPRSRLSLRKAAFVRTIRKCVWKASKNIWGWVHKAQQDGIPIQGYFHWSTMDNHEWNIGQYYRFGLVSVDFETGKRTMTEAGTFLGEVARNNSVEV